MTIKETIENAVSQFGPVAFELYRGNEETYFVYNYEDERGKNFADDKAEYTRYYLQVHYYTPKRLYTEDVKKSIKRELIKIGSITKTMTTEETETNLIHVSISIEIDVAEEEENGI